MARDNLFCFSWKTKTKVGKSITFKKHGSPLDLGDVCLFSLISGELSCG